MASDFYLIIFKENSPSNTLIKRQFNDESKIKILNTCFSDSNKILVIKAGIHKMLF